MAKAKSGKHKSKRAPRSRVDVEFSRPPMIAKILALGLGILTGVGVAATLKPLLNHYEESRNISVSDNDSVAVSMPSLFPESRKAIAPPAIPAPTAPAVGDSKIINTPRSSALVAVRPAIAAQPQAVPLMVPAPRPPSIAFQPKIMAPSIPEFKPRTLVATQSPTLPTVKSQRIAPQSLAIQTPAISYAPPPVPMKPVPVKKAEEVRPVESSLSLPIEMEPTHTQAMSEKLIDIGKESTDRREQSKENVKIASRSVTEDSFKGRLKKAKKIQMADIEESNEDTATSPFQDQLRKSVK
ncbi:MAG: hypothetical protein H7318_18005 [Oligoflexus sp.]|nr:hypothetical protein [Oligoflexus sp.]